MQLITVLHDTKDWQIPFQLKSLTGTYLAGFKTKEARRRYMVLMGYAEDDDRPAAGHRDRA